MGGGRKGPCRGGKGGIVWVAGGGRFRVDHSRAEGERGGLLRHSHSRGGCAVQARAVGARSSGGVAEDCGGCGGKWWWVGGWVGGLLGRHIGVELSAHPGRSFALQCFTCGWALGGGSGGG